MRILSTLSTPVVVASISLAGLHCGDDSDVVPGDGGLDAADAGDTGPVDSAPPMPEPCESEGEVRCSDDIARVQTCVDGFYSDRSCIPELALCEDGACVPRWSWGSPTWDQCDDAPLATAESLEDKASYFDEIARRLHLDPVLKSVSDLRIVAGVSEEDATVADVELRELDANDGLWSALYLASQAHRYAVTGSSDALEIIRTLLEGERLRTEITGVPGLFARRYVLPGASGSSCPIDPAAYAVDPEKDDNRWVQIADDGCAQVTDPETGEWMTTDHCVDERFAGGCFFDNMSQDEVVGHVLGLSAVARLVDDTEVRDEAVALLREVSLHLVRNQMEFVDWDGRVTEHGRIFSPIMALAFVRTGGAVSGDAEIREFYEGCLLQRGEAPDPTCVPWLSAFLPLDRYLDVTLLYVGSNACQSNWNNMSMTLASLHAWLQLEDEPDMQRELRRILDESIMRYDSPRAMVVQHNPWWNFMWAADRPLGPGTDGRDMESVRDGICALREFPASKAQIARNPGAPAHRAVCTGRLDSSLTDAPLSPAERCLEPFLFWFNPYRLESCADDPARLGQPADYLLPYWMGRYYGFIDAP
jgi:hypothetical protein